LVKFLQVVGDFDVEREDVVMMMFVPTLKREARAWYKSLPDASIDRWDSFQDNKFTERWTNTHDIFFLCTVFSIIKKHESEIVFQFNIRFFQILQSNLL
jgi:ubiquinone biosynthesis protein Coq4